MPRNGVLGFDPDRPSSFCLSPPTHGSVEDALPLDSVVADPNAVPCIESRIRRCKFHAALRQDAATLFPPTPLAPFWVPLRLLTPLPGKFCFRFSRDISLSLLATAARFRVPSEGGCGASIRRRSSPLRASPNSRKSPVRIFSISPPHPSFSLRHLVTWPAAK